MLRQAALVIGLLCMSASASAQVQEGNFKLGLDTSLFNFTSFKTSNSIAGQDYETTRRLATFGVGDTDRFAGLPGPVGLTLGYVAHPHIIPQLHLSFARTNAKVTGKSGGESRSDEASAGVLMLRPEFEIPFNPESRFVGYGLAGFDFRHGKAQEQNDDDDDEKIKFNGYGPVLGAGLHIFALPQASFDLGAQFSYLVMNEESNGKDRPGDRSALSFGLTAGLTLWP